MRKWIYECDICGSQQETAEGMLDVEDRGKVYDVCIDCLKHLVRQYIRPDAEEVPAAAETEVQPDAAEEKPAKETDWGKAQALRDAGWKVGDIAEELHVTKQQVYSHTVTPENRRKYPLEEIQLKPF